MASPPLSPTPPGRTSPPGSPPQRRMVMQVTWSLVAGGSEMYAYTIASHLNPDKFSCILCAIDQGGALEGEIKKSGVPYFIMNRRPGIDFRLMWRLYQLFRQTRVDVIQTHHFNQLFYSLLGAKLTGARLIHTEHDIELTKRPRLLKAMQFMSRHCYKMVAIGSDIASMFRSQLGVPESKLEVIRAGVNLSSYNESKAAARESLGLAPQDRVVVIVARLFPEKNHKLLLSAFASVTQDVERARLLIVGEGIEQEAIRVEITRLELSESVQMLGVRRDIPMILAAADVFALTSDREGLPIAVLEAMAAGKPVVATRVGDLPAVVQDEVNGYLVAPGDSQALATALSKILNNDESAAQMGAKAREVAQQYSIHTMIEKYEQIFA